MRRPSEIAVGAGPQRAKEIGVVVECREHQEARGPALADARRRLDAVRRWASADPSARPTAEEVDQHDRFFAVGRFSHDLYDRRV